MLYEWVQHKNTPIFESLKKQKQNVQQQFEARVNTIKVQLAEQGENAELYNRMKCKHFGKDICLVPTSAFSGEGIPDILMLLTQLSQKYFARRLRFNDKLKCTVLEVCGSM